MGQDPSGTPVTAERFPRSVRLTTGRDFEAVLSRGFRISEKHFVVHFLPNDRPHSRLGMTVPRRVGGAVVRNRIRRRIRETFRRELRARIDSGGAADMVVRALPGAASASFSDLRAQLASAVGAWERRGRASRGGDGRPRGRTT